MEKIYIEIEALIAGSKSSDYNKGVQDALNILKSKIDPVLTEVVEDAIWNYTHQD